MKIKRYFFINMLTVLFTWCSSAILIAGDLEPTAPPVSTMKTLDEVEPRIPIHKSDLPLTITESGSYYLVEDANCLSTAITVEADNVTIDLMGYSLIGHGTGFGIYLNARINVEIRNGTVRDFGSDGICGRRRICQYRYDRGHLRPG